MTALTLQVQSETTALPLMAAPTATKRGLTASWFKADGKLVCKWFPVKG
ncbi:hypothetical protein [Stenomitos frigidus]|nr:hypothetical protein [Stenomitos frigidus]